MAMIKSGVFLVLWVLVVVTGVYLGSWQLDRLVWKRMWLDRIDQAYSQPIDYQELNLSDAPCTFVDRTYFKRASVRVTYDLNPARTFVVLPRVVEGMFGKYVYTRAALPDGSWLWINRGFVPNDVSVPPPPRSSHVVLQVRATDVSMGDLLKDNPSLHLVDLKQSPACLPLAIVGVVETSDMRVPWPQAVGTRPTPPNDHLYYACFWFGMSIIALIMGLYFIWVGFKRKYNVRAEG